MKNLLTCLLLITLNFAFSSSIFSQSGYLKKPADLKLDSLPYLGQSPQDTIPEIFGPGFISSTSASEYSICFSQDGKEIYFSRNTPGVSNTIWWTHYVNNAWTTPVYAPFTGNYYNSEPCITYNNQKMYFVSERGVTNDFQLWYTTRSGSNWSTPQKLTAPFSIDSAKMAPSVASNGNLYFTQFDVNFRGKFFMARNINGNFEAPVMLSTTVNAFYTQGHSFIAPDESYIVFDAIPTQQSTGSRIYVSFRKSDSTWGNPIMLSNTINSTDNQYLPYISPDGKYLFFEKQGDIWWVDSKVVTRYKPVGIKENGKLMPDDFILFQNFPNPFNPSTNIKYQIANKLPRQVSLKVYDVLGKEVATLVNEVRQHGSYNVDFDASKLSSGIYFYRLNTGDFSDTKKMILIK
ncbi:MAG: T9SS type A sorting domain-containing protein [Ignavibacteriae bacterium]|nr:T9SS type A sorting domain-containing protein [Ignavibacteriota bacterium]